MAKNSSKKGSKATQAGGRGKRGGEPRAGEKENQGRKSQSFPSEPNPSAQLEAETTPAPTTQVEGRVLNPAALNMKLGWGILGFFALLSLIVFAASWSGYQVNRHTKAAEAALAEERYLDAVEHLSFIVGVHPGAYVRWEQLGDARLELAEQVFEGKLQGDQKQWAKGAMEAYGQAMGSESKSNLDARRGRAAFLSGEIAEALQLFETAIQQDPRDPHANYYIGLYHIGNGHYRRGAQFLEAATADKKLAKKIEPRLEFIAREVFSPEAPTEEGDA